MYLNKCSDFSERSSTILSKSNYLIASHNKALLSDYTPTPTQQFNKQCNCRTKDECPLEHSRPQRPRSFWSAPRIATSGQVQHRKSAIHGLPVTLRLLRVKSDKSDWFWSQSIVFTNPFKTGMLLDGARGRDSWC